LELRCARCVCAVAVGGQESRACSEVLVNATWLVGENGVEDHKGGRSVEC